MVEGSERPCENVCGVKEEDEARTRRPPLALVCYCALGRRAGVFSSLAIGEKLRVSTPGAVLVCPTAASVALSSALKAWLALSATPHQTDTMALYRVTGKHGAVVRDGPETSSALVGTVPVLEVVRALDVQTNSKGVERVKIEGAAMVGWVSRRLLEKADAKKSKDLKIAVEWKDGDTLLKRLAVEAEPGATVHDVKLSLEAMTRVPAARQVLVKNDVELRDHEGVAVSTLIMREEKAKQRPDLQTVRGGDALAAFLPPPEPR